MDKNNVRTQYKAPEGRYVLNSERLNGLVQFQSQRGVRLTIATLTDDGATSKYIIYNVSDSLHISELEATDKVRHPPPLPLLPLRPGAWRARLLIDDPHPQDPKRSLMLNTQAVRYGFPTCHAYSSDARDGGDLLVGMGNGEGAHRCVIQPT
jgi:hypothetical protein